MDGKNLVTATLNPRDAVGALYALLAMCEKSAKENDEVVDGFTPELFSLARSVAEGILVAANSAETEIKTTTMSDAVAA